MKFDRVRAKWDARACMATAHPHPMVVTLLYLVLATLIPLVILGVTVIGPALMGRGIYEASLALSLTMLFLVLVMNFYQAIVSVGYLSYGMHLARRQPTAWGDLLDGFNKVGLIIRTVLLLTLKMLLWMLPVFLLLWGCILALGMAGGTVSEVGLDILLFCYWVFLMPYIVWVQLRYALVFFFLLDEPEAGARCAVRNSVTYMNGWKWELFVLQLSFLGWELLSTLTLGMVGLWVTPYQTATTVHFYDFVTGRKGQPEWDALNSAQPF